MIFDKIAVSKWQLAISRKIQKLSHNPLPAWDWVWVALGAVAQAWPLGGPRAQGSNGRNALPLQQKVEKGGGGGRGALIADIAVIADIARDRKTKA